MTVPGTIDHRFVQDVKKGINFMASFLMNLLFFL